MIEGSSNPLLANYDFSNWPQLSDPSTSTPSKPITEINGDIHDINSKEEIPFEYEYKYEEYYDDYSFEIKNENE